MGGAAALSGLLPRLPADALPRLAPLVAKAAFAVLRTMPEQASEEQELNDVLRAVLKRCVEAHGSAGLQKAADAGDQAAPAGDRDEHAVAPLPGILKQLMDLFVQHLLSSRSSVAVRTAASTGLQVCSGPGVHMCLGLVFVPTLPTPLVRLLCQCRRSPTPRAAQWPTCSNRLPKYWTASWTGGCSQFAASRPR